jgi:hypothetical protein
MKIDLMNDLFLLLAFIVNFVVFIPTQAQEVNNISFFQSPGNTITITYSLVESKLNQKFDVALYVSQDNGQTFQGPLRAVSGDIGKNIQAGENEIIWDVFQDVPSLSGEVSFEVRAIVVEERNWFIMYNPDVAVPSTDYISPLGFRIGKLGGTGFYVAVQLNGDFLANSNYDFSFVNNRIEDYESAGYYVFTDELYKPRFSVKGGATFQFGKNIFVYAGTGLGVKSLNYAVEEFSYESLNPSGKIVVRHEDFSAVGPEVEGGLIFRKNSLLFSAGISNLNFEYSFVNVGLGFNF